MNDLLALAATLRRRADRLQRRKQRLFEHRMRAHGMASAYRRVADELETAAAQLARKGVA